ncbi:1,4-alpha-glucan branching protein GlgB [Rhizosphaericola mali]|uniref:1,4-alpha-glucan branching enzyme GlgB n=1 Tax=Rhizosphaericola mali TaxID=2545455 RepID=A0A5P2G0Z2_9BACT|nr:1,4-alpha-glucan branching protein GlgB [Rhizosphaericola mali]QES87490.1 1,4-alpha-glucan branching protein GlgB [Rhizosphaericola mali]
MNQIQKYEQENFIDTSKSVWNFSLFTEEDIRNFQGGTHYRIYEQFGNHLITVLSTNGIYFSVWAPSAKCVSVIGNFNNWDKNAHSLNPRMDNSGIWEGFIPNLNLSENYKYTIETSDGDFIEKSDPLANFWELRPSSSTLTWNLDYDWQDKKWMSERKERNSLTSPFSIYEVHLGSWMRPDKHDETRYNSYLDLIHLLVPYVKKMHFTHVEIMPVMEYPFDGSWGYQCLGFFAPTSRFGSPQEFMQLIDAFHDAEIGVILDWVPSHFPGDAHGLYKFDGSHVYEYADTRKGYHPDWNSYIFNYGRGEVRSFLISSARFWCDLFHADGLRVDAVSSVIKLDYSREEGEWERNQYGGNGNIEAIQFVKDLNEMLYRDFPDIQTIAEESTDWPGVSKPLYDEGLGFGMKWMMGWMHDTLDYFQLDPIERRYHQNDLTFSLMYYYDENFVLPLSHDEVVHGKSPILYKMNGDEWQKAANLRLMYTYMYLHPGAKLLFMGNEFGATNEWNYSSELQWELLQYELHKGIQNCVTDLNQLLLENECLYSSQFLPEGFEWLDIDHVNESVISFKRKYQEEEIIVILNMTPVVRNDWYVTLLNTYDYKEVFNSNDRSYWGSGDVFNPIVRSEKKEGQQDLIVNLPPLAGIVLKKISCEKQ